MCYANKMMMLLLLHSSRLKFIKLFMTRQLTTTNVWNILQPKQIHKMAGVYVKGLINSNLKFFILEWMSRVVLNPIITLM